MTDKAKSLLSALDESQVQSADVFFNMGINFFNAGDVQEATSYFGKAITKDPPMSTPTTAAPSRTWARASRPRPRPTSRR